MRPSPSALITSSKIAGSPDLLLVTVNVPFDLEGNDRKFGPKRRMRVVGAVLEPIPVNSMDVIMTQRRV